MKTKIDTLINELLGDLTLEQYVEECAKRGILSKHKYQKRYREIPNAKYNLGNIDVTENDFFNLVKKKFYFSFSQHIEHGVKFRTKNKNDWIRAFRFIKNKRFHRNPWNEFNISESDFFDTIQIELKEKEKLTFPFNNCALVPIYFLDFYAKDLGPVLSMLIIQLMYYDEMNYGNISYSKLADKIGVTEKELKELLKYKNTSLFILQDGDNLRLNKLLWKDIREKYEKIS